MDILHSFIGVVDYIKLITFGNEGAVLWLWGVVGFRGTRHDIYFLLTIVILA